MSKIHANELWALRYGRDPARLSVVRSWPTAPGQQLKPYPYTTIALHEFHTVGPDGVPAEHRTVHVIRASDGLESYSYRFDTDAAVVEVLRGGTASPAYHTGVGDIHAVDITLARPLRSGETASFEYRTVFAYRTPPPHEFRRASRHVVENVELHVQFHPALLPTALWLAIWDDLDAPRPSEEYPAALEPDGSVHTFLDALRGIVGYRWTFEPQRNSRRRSP
nr:hypothetical protein [Kibdelosporangium sp. MJ126-NF4]